MKETRILILFLFLLSLLKLCTSFDTITSERSIVDGETIVSADESFELGFFSPGDSSRRYVGIWFKKLDPNNTVVWVANREAPLNDRFGVLNITDKGVLILLSSRKEVVWSSSNASRIITGSPVGQLMDTGNLVVKDGNENEYLWESFDYGGDTLLPGMKIGKNLVTGFEWSLSSWKSIDDPTSGEFRYQLDLHGVPQFLVKKGNTTQYRIGSWNGIHLTGAAAMRANSIYTYMFVWNTKEVYYDSRLTNVSVPTRFVITPTGLPQRFTWKEDQWVSYYRPIDQCDSYAICGSFGSCNINEYPVCSCLKGFEPVSPSKWKWSNWADGCSRKDKLSCDHLGDGFLKLTEVKLPDTSSSWFNKSMGLQECEEKCLSNCTCVAYATLNVSSGIGCLIWFDDLIDIKQLSVGDGQDLYVRVVASELDNTETITQGKKQGGHRKKGVIVITVFSIIAFLGILLLSWILYRRKKKLKKKELEKEMDLPIFDLSTIVSATNDFSHNNKLGEGGFGPVYKGELKEKQQIAVKRLSRSSGQGIEEFKNEVKLIAKLQHRNLVKLLGCCIQGDEKMLIYEYMPNKSLDNFIFGEAKSSLLDWHTRFNIILGISRGLLYLHQDSRLRIIHRDLKASNVLLDKDMNPKISDFGMARMFAGEETGGKTRRVVGTYGYMSPEYAVDGVFSVKSDVFSFGVLVLEIVSGKRNREFFHPDHSHNLLGHAWKLWMDERPLDLVEDIEGASSDLPNVLRCIHVGLLCVQQQPADRPTMSFVVLMLGSDMPLPQPKQPGYYTERYLPNAPSPARNPESSSTNEYTITLLEAR